MSLFDAYDPHSEELIKPSLQRSYREEENFPEVIIGAFKEETFRILEQVCHPEEICTLRGGRTIPVYRVNWRGRDIGLFHTLMGGPGTVCLMEGLIARKAKKFLLYGNCGVLRKDIAAGHLILPTAAYRDEGVSYHYLPAGDYVEVPTHDRLAQIMADCILRGKEVREDVEALRAGYTEMRYCFGEDDVVSALNDLAKKSGI